MGELFVSLLLRLLSLAFLLAFVGYGLFVILAILFKAARFFLAYVRDATGRFIRTASFNLALWAVWGCRYGILRVGMPCAAVSPRDRAHQAERPGRENARAGGAVERAQGRRGILGMGEKFSKDDLRGAYGAPQNRLRRNRENGRATAGGESGAGCPEGSCVLSCWGGGSFVQDVTKGRGHLQIVMIIWRTVK